MTSRCWFLLEENQSKILLSIGYDHYIYLPAGHSDECLNLTLLGVSFPKSLFIRLIPVTLLPIAQAPPPQPFLSQLSFSSFVLLASMRL